MIKTDDILTNLQRYLNTSQGLNLLKEHSLDDYGIWVITGEAGGDMHSGPGPQLGIVEGKLEHVIEYGAGLKNFYNWGAGGTFTFLGESLPVIDSSYNQTRKNLLAEEAELSARLIQVRAMLG